MLGGIGLRDFGGAVGTAVLNDEDFDRLPLLINELNDLIQRFRQPSLLVVGGDYEA